jgi:mandelamide amidase
LLQGGIAAAAGLALGGGLGGRSAKTANGLLERSAVELVDGFAKQEFKVADYVELLIEQRARLAHLNAFINTDDAGLRAAAGRADQAIADGDIGPLTGLPLAVKDNIDSRDLPTTAGTSALESWRPAANAPVLQSLLDAGALLAGKTNMHELAFGITSNNAGFGAVHNPYHTDLIPGGSSGGTAAAVAARLVPAGLGSDTSGSCRIPAALCGCVGVRPTLGRYSQTGVVPLSHTLDTIGPLARTLEDVLLLDRICAKAALEPVSKPIEELRIGVPDVYFYENLDPELERVVAIALERFRGEGAQLVEASIDDIQTLNDAVSFPIVLFEVLRELSTYLYLHDNSMSVIELVDQVASADVKELLQSLMADNGVPAAAYRDVLAHGRPALQQAYASYFADNALDALVVPTTPLPARPIGHDETVELNGEQVSTVMTYIRNTDPPSNAGLPCLSVPAGLTASGLPVGVEFVGPAGGDAMVLAIGARFEQVTGRLPAPSI